VHTAEMRVYVSDLSNKFYQLSSKTLPLTTQKAETSVVEDSNVH
jgi:hypothetical protein